MLPEAQKIINKIDETRLRGKNERSVYNADYDFYVNTDSILRIDNGTYHSLTFPVFRLSETGFLENLVLSSQPDGSYVAYLYKYNLTTQEKLDIFDGKQSLISNPIARMVLPLFDSNSLSSRLITIWYTDIIVIPCSSGDHGVKNFGLWHQCTVTPPQIFVVSRPLVVDDGNGDGWVEGGNYNPGSMSGGYYGPEGVYNPNVPPFDPNTDFALVKGQITRPLGARPTAEQNFFNNDLNPDQKYILQHNSAVRTIILNFLNANKLSNNAFKEDAKFSAKQMLTLLAGDASQANLDHCQELAEFLTENGGTIEFSSAVTAQNSVSFEDFVELMALPLVADEPHYSLNGDQVLATQKFYRNWLYDIEVDVVQELTPYSVVDVDSDLVGVTYAHGWEQGVFVPHTTALGNMDLKVRGTELHYITAGGLGEVYRRKLTLGMYINKTDGHIFGQYTE